MRSHRRRGPLEHVLVAADAAELASVRALLALLPDDAYGQAYLEVGPGETPELTAPARVGVVTLPRSADDRPGERLTEAARAWVAEWMPEEPDPTRSVAVWVGATCAALDAPLERL